LHYVFQKTHNNCKNTKLNSVKLIFSEKIIKFTDDKPFRNVLDDRKLLKNLSEEK